MNATKSQPLFAPKLFSTLKEYSLRLFWGDLTSGVIVGIVALPLAIAFAIASGVTPDRGLVTAVIAGFLISALGGSRVQIGGPTGAFVVIVYRIVEQHGVNGLILCTLMAGGMLVAMGLLRLGSVIKFIPYPLTVGFTSGIAVIIFASQIKDFLGLNAPELPADFLQKAAVYAETLDTVSWPTVGVSLFALAVLLVWPKINRKIPGSIVAIVAATALVHGLGIPVETIGSRFGEIPHGLPAPQLPSFTFHDLQVLIGPAFTVAMLGAIESLLSATVADGMIESRHRSNTELIAQGAANLVTPLFGGIPATGAIARTATNVKNGGRTPVAGMVHAATLLLIMLLFGKWAGLIPLCVLAAILTVVAYHMSEWRAFKALLNAPRMDVVVLLVTFFLTVLVNLTVAIQIGMLLAVILFMKRMTEVTTVKQVSTAMSQENNDAALRHEKDAVSLRQIPEGVQVYEAEGAFFFGIAENLRDLLDVGKNPPRVLILRTRHVLAVDATAIRALLDLHKTCRRAGTSLLIEGVHAQPLFAFERGGVMDVLGRENFKGSLDGALERAREILGQSPSLVAK